MLIRNSQVYRFCAWFIFTAIFILIICTFQDYGVTWDEELQSQYGQAIFDYYLSGFKDDRYREIFNLYLYGGTFDGLASAVDHFTPFRVYDTRHLLNALFGLLGLWGTWRLGRILGSPAVGLIALLLCATTPMYYGHMFNNPKDIPFAAGIVWTLYFMIRSYSKPEMPVLIKLGITLGLTLGVRVGGVMIVPFWLAPLAWTALLPLYNQSNKPCFQTVAKSGFNILLKRVLPVAVIAYVIMLICWPWAQLNPILNPLKALGEFSNFPQEVEVLLDGTTYRSTQLPWYYVPLYFGIQLPEFILFLLAVTPLFLRKNWQQFSLPQKQGFVLITLMGSFPVFYAVLRHPALYDTVRHFLFAVPLICVVSALTARSLYVWILSHISKPWSRHVCTGIVSLIFLSSILVQIFIMMRLHPYEYIFANQFAGGVRGAFGRYETDYWGSSFKEAAQDIQAYVTSEGGVQAGKILKIAICGPWDSAMIYLPPDFEPVIANEPAEFFLSTTRWQCQNMRPGKEIIRIERLGVPLAIVKDLRGGYEHYEGNKNDKN